MLINNEDHNNAAPQTDPDRSRAAVPVRPLRRRSRPRSPLSALPGRAAAKLAALRAAAHLAAGDRVRCTWSGKVGTVLDPACRVDRHWPGALVVLDPFLPAWSDTEITDLEVIYSPKDLETLPAPA